MPPYDDVAAPPIPSRDWAARRVSARLPQFPWDRLDPYRERAEKAVRRFGGEVADLSVGTPVDPTPEVVQAALRGAANAPGYPQTYGTAALREAAAGWLARRCGATAADPAAILPTIGSKELVASLPGQLGLGTGDVVVHPELAYPTYDIGARLCGAEPLPSDSLVGLGPRRVALLWLNSPANPTGQVLPLEHLRKVVRWARERGVIVVSDECYIELGWDATPVSVLHPDVCDGSYDGLLAVHSLSKRSNLAGYRAGFVAGDRTLVRELLEVRKHAGLMVPTPVQAAMVAALSDDTHADEQRRRYAARRSALMAQLGKSGFRVDHSDGGLYVWATRGEPCWDTVAALADRGVLAAPGVFYGPRGAEHVRLALTATDDAVARAVQVLDAPQRMTPDGG